LGQNPESGMQSGAQRGLEPVKFLIDTRASRFTVEAFASGFLSAFGHSPTIAIRDYDGEVAFLPGTYDKAYVQVVVRTGNMDVVDDISSDDRRNLEQAMYNQVLEVKRFPTASFETRTVTVEKLGNDLSSVRANGNLTFHGVTRTLSFDARVSDMGSMLRISGAFPLRQSDYAIEPYSFAGGALRLKDELKFKFELVARVGE
jgi:polyisoprenoid-binding protein YceI